MRGASLAICPPRLAPLAAHGVATCPELFADCPATQVVEAAQAHPLVAAMAAEREHLAQWAAEVDARYPLGGRPPAGPALYSLAPAPLHVTTGPLRARPRAPEVMGLTGVAGAVWAAWAAAQEAEEALMARRGAWVASARSRRPQGVDADAWESAIAGALREALEPAQLDEALARLAAGQQEPAGGPLENPDTSRAVDPSADAAGANVVSGTGTPGHLAPGRIVIEGYADHDRLPWYPEPECPPPPSEEP